MPQPPETTLLCVPQDFQQVTRSFESDGCSFQQTDPLPDEITGNAKTLTFYSVLDQALEDLRVRVSHEFAQHVKDPSLHVKDPELACVPFSCTHGKSSSPRDSKHLPHRFNSVDSILYEVMDCSDSGNLDGKLKDCTESSQDGTKWKAESEASIRLSKHSEAASVRFSGNTDADSSASVSVARGRCRVSCASRWARFVQMIIRLCRGKFSILSCWIPAESDSSLQGHLEACFKPIGQGTQVIDEFWFCWNLDQHKGISMVLPTSSRNSTGSHANFMLKQFSLKAKQPKVAFSRLFVLHPLSIYRCAWCFFGLLGIVYDAIMISLTVFDVKSSPGTATADWFLRIYWLVDIGVSFRTGFYLRNVYQNGTKAMARYYLKTWFAIDVVAVIPDWIITLIENNSAMGDYSQTFRYLKAVKMLRLVRIAKTVVYFRDLLDSLNSVSVLLVVHLGKYSMMVMCWVHSCACFWYWIGKKNAGDSWITRHHFQNMRLPQTYFISLQWAFAQLQGSSDITGAYSATERGLHAAIVMVSIFVLAIFISNVTNSLIQLEIQWAKKAEHLRALHDYLLKHRVRPLIAEDVRKYCEEKLRIERKLQFGEDDVTKMLPRALRRALLVEVRAHMIKQNNPFFLASSRYLPKTFERLCCDIVTPFFEGPDTLIYNYSERCKVMFFNVAGNLVYDHVNNNALGDFVNHLHGDNHHLVTRSSTARTARSVTQAPPSKSVTKGTLRSDESDASPADTIHRDIATSAMRDRMHEKEAIVTPITVEKCQPICEAALWTTWTHCGDMTATSHIAFLVIDVNAFAALVDNDLNLQRMGVDHAVRWIRFVNGRDISDLLTSNDVLEAIYKAGEISSQGESSKPMERRRHSRRISILTRISRISRISQHLPGIPSTPKGEVATPKHT